MDTSSLCNSFGALSRNALLRKRNFMLCFVTEWERYSESLQAEKSQLRAQIDTLQCQIQPDCCCTEIPSVALDSCTSLQGPGVCCTGAMELLSSWANEKRCLLGTIHSLKELISKVNRADFGGMDDWRRTLLIAVQQVFSKELGHLYAEKVLLGALLPCGGVEQWNDMIKFDEKLQ
ncbi:uncharacterized protein LOC142358098, partial [Convolutriloba macropyga]|uniref:uncharacterized protein LOC142358098 n=1 Tax=Convolutriloba macropyga TaxID=536237 RepID=UPI003F525F50